MAKPQSQNDPEIHIIATSRDSLSFLNLFLSFG